MLFETAAGFALFKVLQEGKLSQATDLFRDFETLDAAQKVKLCIPYPALALDPLRPASGPRADQILRPRVGCQAEEFQQV